MTGLHLYAFVREPLADAGEGLAGEPLRSIAAGDVLALAGAMDREPPLDVAALRGHEAVVNRTASRAEAVLPARFQPLLRDESELRDRVGPHAASLRAALEAVAGCVQLDLRPAGPAPVEASEAAPAGPGAAYLVRRRGAAAPELEAARRALSSLVVAERVDRGRVSHLVRRELENRYRAAVAALAPPRPVLSGPWPAWAFGPEGLR